MRAILDYFRDLGLAAIRGWDRFFFRAADPTRLGVIRVILGLLLIWNLGNYAVDLPDYFGASAWADSQLLEDQAPMREGHWSLWLLIPPGAMPFAWAVALGVAVMLTVGLFSRVNAILAVVIVISTARRNPVALFGFDQMLSLWLLYLAVSGASGAALSVDRWLTVRRAKSRGEADAGPCPSVGANLGIRLIQLHLCTIYAFAGLAKLQGNVWWNGEAVGRVIANGEFSPMNLTGLLAYPELVNVLTYSALLIELLYPVLIWVPILRPLMIVLAVGMHAGIGASMGLYEFGFCMTAANLAFADLERLRRGRSVAGSELESGTTAAYTDPSGPESTGATTAATSVDRPSSASPGPKAKPGRDRGRNRRQRSTS